jgi:DNA-binding XRE family transcriptional regulator
VLLHEAVAAALTSPWVERKDDLRAVIALECAMRSRLWAAEMQPDLVVENLSHHLLLAEVKSREPGSANSAQVITGMHHLVEYVRSLVSADLMQHTRRQEYLGKVERLRTGYGLGETELATLLDVTRQALHKWETGGTIALESAAKIDRAFTLLLELESYVKPGLLPVVIRRPGRSLRGRTPLSLILTDKGHEVARYFEWLTTADVEAS